MTSAMIGVQGSGGPSSFAVLQVDIERLGDVNEALGFMHGDQLLRDFGDRLRAAVPEALCIARLRGDEFALLLSPCSEATARAEANHLHALLETPFVVADIALSIGAHVGIAMYSGQDVTAGDLLRQADVALKHAKKRQADVSVYDPATVERRPEQLALAGELRRAIEQGDLRLYLQPKVDFASGTVQGAEALVRWAHPERGLILPGEFIALAEQTGLIKSLTEWMIESVMRVLREARPRGRALPIAVNLSARNLRDESLLAQVRRLREHWGIAPDLLEFEITETTVMDDPEFALRVLRGLRADGSPLYIDDFGTGYSSLSYLLKLPVAYIKIDQSFVRDMSTNKDSATIVKSTIELAHELGRKVVAEGIESREDWDRLAAFGCDVGQGYFIARPMPAEQFDRWVRTYESARSAAAIDA